MPNRPKSRAVRPALAGRQEVVVPVGLDQRARHAELPEELAVRKADEVRVVVHRLAQGARRRMVSEPA